MKEDISGPEIIANDMRQAGRTQFLDQLKKYAIDRYATEIFLFLLLSTLKEFKSKKINPATCGWQIREYLSSIYNYTKKTTLWENATRKVHVCIQYHR